MFLVLNVALYAHKFKSGACVSVWGEEMVKMKGKENGDEDNDSVSNVKWNKILF